MDEYRRANRALWDNWTALHAPSGYYDVEGFKAGKSTLTPIEIDGIGDVAGKSLLHLQCHFGLDTLSWARHGMEYGWAHPLSEVITALLAAGLGLDSLREFPYSDYPSLPAMERGDDGWWRLPGKNRAMVPLLYSLRATKPDIAGGR